jgi:serine/threonine protein kinase
MASDQCDSLEWAKPRLPISNSLEISRSISNQIKNANFLAPSPALCLLTSFVRTTASRNVKDLDLFNFSTVSLAQHQSNFLGEGATYRVTKGTPSDSSGLSDKLKAVAIKTAKVSIPRTLTDLAIDDEHCHRLRSILFEVEILSHPSIRQHPNIATLLAYSWGALSGGFVPSLVMELATLGNARSFLSLQVLSDEQKLRVCSDVASGLQFLHACKIVHGDIKLDNVLVYEEEVTGFVVKIADFDRSPQSTEHNSYTGTRFYNAPEVQRQMSGSGKTLASSELWLCDVFAFGLLTLEVFAGVRFYGDLPGADRLINRINLGSQSGT